MSTTNKKARLTLEEKWFVFWGKNYLVNHNKKEIHRLQSKHVNCLPIAKKNKQYVSFIKAITLIRTKGYNGCRWCWKSQDKG